MVIRSHRHHSGGGFMRVLLSPFARKGSAPLQGRKTSSNGSSNVETYAATRAIKNGPGFGGNSLESDHHKNISHEDEAETEFEIRKAKFLDRLCPGAGRALEKCVKKFGEDNYNTKLMTDLYLECQSRNATEPKSPVMDS